VPGLSSVGLSRFSLVGTIRAKNPARQHGNELGNLTHLFLPDSRFNF